MLANKLFCYYVGSMKQKKRHDIVAFIVRLPKTLHATLRSEAKRENRSINSQMIQILQERYAKGKPLK